MKRVAEYDGARGVAILLVFLGHLPGGVYPHDRPWGRDVWAIALRGATLVGLQLFFVLSGFLITSVLLREQNTSGGFCVDGIDLGRFYSHRARRLLPALLAVCVVFTVWTLLTSTGAARSLRLWELLPTLTYTWDLPALHPRTAFLSHAWSVAVEEQFYLLWPFALIVGMRIAGRRGAMALAAVGIVVVVLARHLGGFSAVAVDHGLRWDALLAGCLLALWGRHLPVAVGAVGWVVLAVFTVLPVDTRYAYETTWLAASLAIIGSLGSGWLRHPVLTYFGRVSYGLYLWHLLIMRLGLPGPV